MSNKENEPKKEIVLTDEQRVTLNSMKRLHLMDRGSQIRLRAKVDRFRKTSPDFARAFEESLESIYESPVAPQKESIFGSMMDVITHPITALKGKIAHTMLNKRNKAPAILVHPDPVLAKVAEPWDFEKGDQKELMDIVRKLGAALRETKYGHKLGIAAPQIGISKRIFVCQGAVCVNPTFTPPKSNQIEEFLEGCYSVPHRLFKTKRPKYGWAEWYSVDGVKREFKLKGTDALVFQHELDHLDGKCCIDIGVEYIQPKPEEPKKVEAPAA